MARRTLREDIPPEVMTGPLRRDSVRKNVAAIHVSGKLTLLQRKLSNVLLLNAYDHLTTRTSHRIDARTLCVMAGYNSNDTATLKDALRSLAETVAEWDMLDAAGRQEWGVSALLSYASLKDGVCEYAYSPALAEKLHDPKVFALINMNIQRRFQSGHALALYENCYRFHRVGSTGWWPMALFRRLMGVADSAYYESFKHLNAKVIKPAVAEVNATSNIRVAPETRKVGRQIAEIRFLIEENPQLSMLDLDDGDGVRSGEVYGRLRALGVADRLARQWIAEHGEEAVARRIAEVEGRSGVRSPARYLSAAMRDGWTEAETPAPDPEAARRVAEAAVEAEARTRALAAREAAVEAERQGRAARLGRVLAAVDARSPVQRDAAWKLFLDRLEGDLEREDFRRYGWRSGINARAVFAFWEELEPEVFEGLGDAA
ncbi:replication initiation protein [Jannaschia rubra]|uniref:Protein involved in initiation of plasmid replication n=1 Tax=Jannaschia rubra TaxID=282197 RepID=A0A0M6XW48_9RHOB|nr:replication initiation protein [Jannaschia rubra]CTQ34797.1 Protein involved in initiation of plasmid replication [Jannaschia rubra]SFG80565.1 Initiator Replication protein [Jannaschia rubra]